MAARAREFDTGEEFSARFDEVRQPEAVDMERKRSMSSQAARSSAPAPNPATDGAERERVLEAEQQIGDAASAAKGRCVRSLILAWHDEESGDELRVNVQGSQRFLEGLRPLGFVPLGEQPARGVGQRLPAVHPAGEIVTERDSSAAGAPRRRSDGVEDPSAASNRPASGPNHHQESEVAEHRVRWTVRLARPWNPLQG